MTRHRSLIPILVATLALVAGACGSPDDGALRALPRGGAGGTSEAASALAADASVGGGGGWAPYQPVTYVPATGLKAPSSAPAYEIGGGDPSEADVRRLATALGLKGDVESEERTYRVTDGDTVLEVLRNAVGAWMVINDGATELLDSCAVAVGSVVVDPAAPEGDGDTPVSSEPAPRPTQKDLCPEPPPVDGLLEPGEAVARTKAILEAAGTSSFDFDVAEGDSSTRSTGVEVSVSFDGHSLHELSTWWEFGEDGVVLSATGFLGSPKSIGDYPLVSASEAVERLNDNARGADLHDPVTEPAPQPRPAEGAVSAPAIGVVDCPPEADCIAPEPGVAPVPEPRPEPEQLEPVEVEITEVGVVYALVPTGPCEDDAVLLVPSFELTYADGSAWIEAVTDEHLAAQGDEGDAFGSCPEDGEGQEPGREPAGEPGGAGEPGVEPVPLPAESEPAPAPEAESKVATTSQ